jgi:hypothetical protein
VLESIDALECIQLVLTAYPGGDLEMETAAAMKTGLQYAHWEKQPWQLEMLLRQTKPDLVVAAHWPFLVTEEMQVLAGGVHHV